MIFQFWKSHFFRKRVNIKKSTCQLGIDFYVCIQVIFWPIFMNICKIIHRFYLLKIWKKDARKIMKKVTKSVPCVGLELTLEPLFSFPVRALTTRPPSRLVNSVSNIYLYRRFNVGGSSHKTCLYNQFPVFLHLKENFWSSQ